MRQGNYGSQQLARPSSIPYLHAKHKSEPLTCFYACRIQPVTLLVSIYQATSHLLAEFEVSAGAVLCIVLFITCTATHMQGYQPQSCIPRDQKLGEVIGRSTIASLIVGLVGRSWAIGPCSTVFSFSLIFVVWCSSPHRPLHCIDPSL